MIPTQFVTLIQVAERDTAPGASIRHPRFVSGRSPARTLGARWLRAHASGSLRLARVLDPRPSDAQHLAA